ncbi:Na+/H+ antiporter NhaA [Archangium violaceum]|uniref:Na+/H+ antiporter NhaA n=1 Tax=Archangium violaceum TaxID=83451 RepID=UPI0036DF6C22
MQSDSHGLPREMADRFAHPFARFLKVESSTGVILLLSVVVALILSNSPLSSSSSRFWETPVGFHFGAVDFTRSLRHWINDGLMTLFFFVVSLELKRELVHGELRSFRMAAFSFAGALGGMLVPASLYLALMYDKPGIQGWGTVMATDTAFVIGSLALLGSRIPVGLRLYLLFLAIFDDVGSILVVAVGYGGELRWPALAIVAALVAGIFGAARLGIRGVAVYSLLGVGLWLALDASGIHPTLAGVALGLMTPAREWVSDDRLRALFERVIAYPKGKHWSGDTVERADLRRAGVAAREALSPVERLEMRIHPWSGFIIMPLFALANAGVRLSWTELGSPITSAVFVGLAVGKPIGVFTMSWLAVRVGLATRPEGVKWSLLAAGALLTGIGFTMSLFIAGLAFDPTMLRAAKIGILGASGVSGATGLLMLAWLTSEKKARRATVLGSTS